MNVLFDVLDSRDAKMNFLKGIVLIARADGSVDLNEKQLFLNAAAGMALEIEDQKEVLGWLNENEVNQNISFGKKRQALFFLREALQMCYVNKSYTESEQALIQSMAEHLGVRKKSLAKITAWAKEGMEWVDRGAGLLDLEA